jgi:hypothetical protein
MFKNLFKREPKFIPKKYVIFNVDTFNKWFNSKDNGSTYANPGIFLRTSKLSVNHIEEYLVECHGLKLSEHNLSVDIIEFHGTIRRDWMKKSQGDSKLYSKIEKEVIDWSNDGTKTAGTLTRKIIKIIKQKQ